MLTVFTLLMLAFGGMLLVSQHSTGVGASTPSQNDVVPGGVTSVADMRAKYAANKDNVQSAYSRMGITSDMVNKATTKTGTIYKNGEIKVGGTVVATGAQTLGRDYLPGSTKVTPDGHVFYMRSTSVSMASDSLPVIVFYDANGKFTGAVINDCGNPVSAKPVTPAQPKPQASTYKCSALKVVAVDRTNVTMQATPDINGSAQLKSITYTIKKNGSAVKTISATNTNPVTYSQTTPGDYTAEATLTVTDNGATHTTAVGGCTAKFTVDALPASYACTQVAVTGPTNRTQFSFTPKTTVSNGAAFTSVVYTVRDANNNVVFTSPAVMNQNAYNYTQTTAGKYTVAGETTFTVGGKAYTTKDVNCAGSFEVKAVPVTPAATYKCEQLKATPVANQAGVVQFAITAPAEGGAKLTGVTMDYDTAATTDATQQVELAKLSNFTHTYAKNGTYTAQATLTFTVPDGSATTTKTVTCSAQAAVTNYCTIAGKESLLGSDANCKTTATPTPGQGSVSTPTQLVNTGAADVAGIFASVVAAGALAYRFVWARGFNR